MAINYSSTRGGENNVTASMAILKGLAADGGLFMPDHIPVLDCSLEELSHKTYQEVAYAVMKQFLTDFTEEELKTCIERAYDSKFDTEEIAPLVKADGAYYLELFHGSTIAFKDMALSILPHLMTVSAKKNHAENTIVILTATSGDTGKAAMAGFADVEGTRIIVFYPKDGVSRVQELQMLTQKGANTSVVGISGNFDDAQSGVKKIFGDKEFAKELAGRGYQLSSANSINIGRLVPQVVYYVYAYAKLLENGEIENGEKINVTVPTGNFGNILAAYFAKQMGVPIDKLICASNDNKVLYDFFKTGVYDKNRPFILTSSPSMDILISSNLERLLFLVSGYNDAMVADLMKQLNETGKYSVPADVFETIGNQFEGGFCDDVQTKQTIAQLFDEKKYLADTHTAVAVKVYEDYRERTGDTTPTVIASTASPFKFCQSVISALGGTVSGDGTELLDQLHDMTGAPIPAPLAALSGLKPRFDLVIDRENILNTVDLLGQI